MYLHGIPFIHLIDQFPILSTEGRKQRKKPRQKEDARHLVQELGFEPIHLLRTSKDYPLVHCLKECLQYGDVVLAFSGVPFPRMQLSRHEWGLPHLDIRDTAWALTTRNDAEYWFRRHLPHLPLLVWEEGYIGARRHHVGSSCAFHTKRQDQSSSR
ncbi:MAG: hypothetical protein M0Z65_04940 [Firmicutes bacterium]|nr:hypothetical protein [Bacillota bacterium]